MNLDTAPYDGYRVHRVEEDNLLELHLVLIIDGQVTHSQLFWTVRQEPSEDLARFYPEFKRREKLVSAIARAFNEGAPPSEIRDATEFAREWFTERGAVPQLPLTGLEWDESHVRTFLLPTDEYLRIVEDEDAVVISQTDLLKALTERDPESPSVETLEG